MSAQITDLNVYRDWLGIPDAELPAAGPPDHYALLRLVRFEDDDEKIRAHQKKLNAHVRTYASGPFSVQSQHLMNEITKAMLCLTDPERKKDYDEDLGRVVEEKDLLGRMPLGQWLVRKKVISRDQFREAEAFAEARGLSLRDAVVQMKLVKPAVAARALAQELGLTFVDLAETIPDDSVLDKMPRSTVKHNSVLPLFVDDGVLLVACVDEPPHDLEDELRLRYGVPTRWVIATPLAMNQAIAKYYAPGSRESAAEIDTVKKSGKTKATKTTTARVPFSQLSDAEKHEKRLIGIIILCWAFIGSALIDTFVVRNFLITTDWPFFITLIAAPAAVFYVFRVYWK
ncbi:MAG: general secretion pathway protein GspE [Planctomycetota bacterium]|nr:general secretion pathway protein GspE [Planctomycetaceae bacterium]MDQ3331646.1 general secretion pathway protein GspE [Planctomycetota bacterium]